MKKATTRDRLEHLLFGHPKAYPTLELFTAAWRTSGDDLLKRWVERFPCTRPAAWWASLPSCPSGAGRVILPASNPNWREGGVRVRDRSTERSYPTGAAARQWLQDHGHLEPGEAAREMVEPTLESFLA